MSRRRRRIAHRLLLGASLAFILTVVVAEPVRPADLPSTVENAHLVHGLGLSPVIADISGRCPQYSSPSVVWDAVHDRCLTLAEDGLHVTSAKTITVAADNGFWTVNLQLQDPDAHTLAALTTRLATNHHPRNELALILHGPPGGLVLGAPVVADSVSDLELDGGPTQASALALRDLILR